ncbi:MAG: hypothetical protein KDB61_07850 [Planctomycetes bacterium]|nr:hypothetical protein [Planctomycetota bacterium]
MGDRPKPLKGMLQTLDTLLRGGFTDRDRLREGKIQAPVPVLVKTALVLGACYGVMMGLYALFTWETKGTALLQMISGTAKVPLLFLLTLLVTFPSLYVVSALARTRLRAEDTGRLLLIAITVNLALLASLGTITGFFTLSTDSYPFMVLLNVVFFGVSGLAGLSFLRRTLGNLLQEDEEPETEEDGGNEAGGEGDSAPVTPPRRHSYAYQQQLIATERTRRLFAAWCVLFGIVGSQMGWVLRPFIGNPELPFQVFRARESNFLEAVLRTIGKLIQ